MEEPPSSLLFTVGGLIAVVVLIGLNAFFVLSEFSLVAIRRSRVDQLVAEGNAFAPAVRHAVQHLDSYLAACQLGITIASIGLGWIGEPVLAGLLEGPLEPLLGRWAGPGAHTVAVAFAFGVITALHIVFGELMPKSVALQRTERSALAVSLPLRVFLIVFRPAIVILNGTGNLLLRVVGMRPAASEQVVLPVGELRLLLNQSRRAGIIDAREAEMAHQALEFSEIQAREVMVPRSTVYGLAADTSLEEALELGSRTGFTRFPIYHRSLDSILGIIDIKDVAYAIRDGALPGRRVTQVMREALIFPAQAHLDRLLAGMRQQRTQMAIIIDEHGGTAGIVTLEDIVKILIRETVEEFRDVPTSIREEPDGSYVVDGMASLDALSWKLGVEIPSEDAVTVGGWVTEQLGRIPRVGDRHAFDGFTFHVEAVDGVRISWVRLRHGERPSDGDRTSAAEAARGAAAADTGDPRP